MSNTICMTERSLKIASNSQAFAISDDEPTIDPSKNRYFVKKHSFITMTAVSDNRTCYELIIELHPAEKWLRTVVSDDNKIITLINKSRKLTLMLPASKCLQFFDPR